MRTRATVLWFKAIWAGLAVLALVLGGLRPALAQGGAPSGWQPYTVDALSFALPGGWQALPKDEAALAAAVRLIARSNPALARSIQLLIDSGQLGALGFLAADAANGDAASVITAPLPSAVSSQALVAEVSRQLPQLLPGLTIIKSGGGLRIGGVDAARVEFRLSLNLDGGGALTIRAVQFYLLPAGKLHVFSVIGADEARLTTLADQVGATIQVGGAAPAAGSADTRSVANGGNLRREPRVAAGNVLGQLCAGDTVTVLAEQGTGTNRWLRVRVTAVGARCVAARVAVGAEGWASASLIGGGAATPAASNTLTARVAVSGNVRQGPALNATVIGQVKAGEAVTLLGRNAASTWYRITTAKGVTGWSSAMLLSVDAATRARVPVV